MMRPACAYASIIQPGPPNGPDMYGERDGFGFGILHSTNNNTSHPSLSMQTLPSTQGFYPVNPAAGSGGHPVGVVGCSTSQNFVSQQSPFSIPTYSHIHMQSPYSTPTGAEVLSSGQLAATFQPQQPSQQCQTVVTLNGEKLFSSNFLPARGSNPSSGSANQSQSIHMLSSYGNMSTSGQTHQTQAPRLPTGNSVGNIRSLSQPPVGSRSSGARSQMGVPDSNGFPAQSMYTSYTTGNTSTPLGAAGGVQVPYSMAISNSGIPVTMSPMLNKVTVPPVANYGPNASMTSQSALNTVSMGRMSGGPTAAVGLQQSSLYGSQQARLPNVSVSYVATGYATQPYAPSSSIPFRSGASAVVGGTQCAPMAPRPQTASSPQLCKDSSASTGDGVHSSQPPMQVVQLPVCSSAHSCGSPISCSQFSNKGVRSNGGVPVSGTILNSVTGCNMVGPNPSATPPTGIIINGPVQPLGQSGMMTTMNGCLAVGQNNESKPGPCMSDGCYVQNRPMSSGGRPDALSTMTLSGPMGPCSDVLISPTFPMSNNLNNPANMPYAANQQIPVLSGDFDSLPSNPSPMMMMAMPVSSPVPGGPLINGPLPTGMMNMAMAGSTPAPPPYHQPSLSNCRSVGASSSFFNQSSIPPMTSVSTLHLNPACAISSLPDSGNMGLNSDRHFIGTSGDSMTTNAMTKQPTTGSAKSVARPKRTRATKNTAGTGRASKASSRKSAAIATPSVPLTTPSAPDPFAMNIRLTAQPSSRQKLSNWNICPSSITTNFSPTGLTSPPMSMTLPNENRPSSFSASSNVLMRPNSGPPLNPAFTTMPHGGSGHMMITGPADTATRLPSSPRLYSSMSAQHHYLNSSTTTSTSVAGGPFYTGHNSHTPTPCTPASMNISSVQQPLPMYSGNLPVTNSRLPPSSMNSHPHMGSQQTIPAQVALQTSNRAFVHAPTSGSSGPYTSDPAAPSDRLSGPPCSSPAPSATGTSETSIANFTADTDRLVCPITNGMVWGPMQIQLNDVLHQFLPDGIVVRRFEFDLTANHLSTIVGRSDLDIVVCSHLLSEPLQVCHWPSDAVQIRFNEYLLRLDRSSVGGGQSAHKVACVKQLCRPGRNQLEIAILGLGEDPTQPVVINKRRATAATLETHRFAAFMAHMPALNVLLDGLKRRRPAGVNVLCDLLEGRVSPRGDSAPGSGNAVVAELSLICPVFRTRMNVPGRISGCEHVEAFDMESFLRREVLWPRLNCPICGHKSPAGLDGLCIDTTILYTLRLIPPSIESILVRSDGHWRLPHPLCLDLPVDVDQWQPLIGPLTEVVTGALGALSANPFTEGRPNVCVSSANQPTTCALVPPHSHSVQQQFNTSALTRPNSGPTIAHTLTLGKELPTSSWSIKSGSPAAANKLVNFSTEVRSSDGIIESLPLSISRPASQPGSWLGTQPSATKQCSNTTRSTDQCSTSIGAPPSSLPCLSFDAPDAKRSVVYSHFGSDIKSSECVNPPFKDISKIRHRSTSLAPDESLSLESHTKCLPPAIATSTDALICPPNSCSPCHVGAVSIHASSSLPCSPAPTPSTSTISAVPGIGHSSSSNVSNLASPCRSSSFASDSELNANCVKDLPPVCGEYPPPKPTPTTGIMTTSEKPASDWNLSNSTDWKCGDATMKGASAHSVFNKKPTSSLNMGLDFLLAEENSITDQPTTTSESQGLVTGHHAHTPQQHPSSNDLGNSRSPLTDTVFVRHCCEIMNMEPNSMPSVVFNERTTIPHNTDNCLSQRETHPSDCNLSESSPKRIKFDSTSVSTSVPLSSASNGIDAKCDRPFENTVVFSPDTKSIDEKNSRFKLSPHSSCSPDNGQKEYHSHKQDHFFSESSPNPLSFIARHFDEDRLCTDTIHSLSAQIDGIEIFLDDSYIRFVESFPCT